VEERTCFLAGATEFLDSLGQCRIAGARFVQVGAALTGGQSPDCAKDSHFAIDGVTHGKVILYPSMRKARPKGAKYFDAQSGAAGTERTAPVLGRSGVGPPPGLVTILRPGSIGACCGRDGRTPKNHPSV